MLDGVIYLGLSFASGFIELGSVVYAIHLSLPMASEWQVKSSTRDFDACESIGHVFGVAFAILLVLLIPNVGLLLVAAAVFAGSVSSMLTWGQCSRRR